MNLSHQLLAICLGSACSMASALDSSLSFSLHAHAAPAGFSATPMGWNPGAVATPMNLIPAGAGKYYLSELQPRRIRLKLPAYTGASVYLYSDVPGAGTRLQHVSDSNKFMYVYADYRYLDYFGGGRIGGPDTTTPDTAEILFDPILFEDFDLDVEFHFRTEAIDAAQMPGRYTGQITMVFDQIP